MQLDPFNLDHKMANHVRWRLQYRERRYGKHLSRPELCKRIRDITVNMLQLQDDAKIGLRPLNATGVMWMEKFTHMLEEMVFRYGPYPAGFDRDVLHSEPFPNLVSELAKKAVSALAARSLQPGQTFIKYGRRDFMRMLHEEGGLRLQPASYFNASVHNGAVRDDELTIPASGWLDREAVVKLVKNPQDVPEKIDDQRFDAEFKFGSDYWLYCVTTSINPRLFVDFEAEACVIIRDQEEFSKRLERAAKAVIPSFKYCKGAAVYYDALFPQKEPPFIPLTKPFGYSYQSEYRFCWVPIVPAETVAPVDLRLGSLTDISELVEL